MPEIEDLQSWVGAEVVDPDDEKVGKLDELYLDARTGEPTYGVAKAGLLGRTHVFPMAGATFSRGHVRIAGPKELVTASPLTGGDTITAADEATLAQHFGTDNPSPTSDPDQVRYETTSAVSARRAQAEADLRQAEELEARADTEDRRSAELMSAATDRAEGASAATSERDRLLAEAAEARARAERG